MRVIVCGGRTFGEVPKTVPPLTGEALRAAIIKAAREETMLMNTLDRLAPTAVYHGGASGADRHAENWADLNEVPHEARRAKWHALGKSAGPIRNQQMLDEFKPDAVIAFPGGKGTADMVRRAKAAGVRVIEVLAHDGGTHG